MVSGKREKGAEKGRITASSDAVVLDGVFGADLPALILQGVRAGWGQCPQITAARSRE
jgi:hypothetical protein